jgi:hypothetical protein
LHTNGLKRRRGQFHTRRRAACRAPLL